MKNFLFLIIVSVLIFSCDKIPKKGIDITSVTLCDVYNTIDQNNQFERYLFLMAVRTQYCAGELNQCILDNHDISTTEYNRRINLVWGSKPIPYTVSFSAINSLISNENDCLYKYVGFDINSQNVITNMKLYNYEINQKGRFSIPLFNSLKNKYGLQGTDQVKFFTAKKDASSTVDVVFELSRNNIKIGYNYDVTIDPSFYLDFKYLDKFLKDYPNPYKFIK